MNSGWIGDIHGTKHPHVKTKKRPKPKTQYKRTP